MHTGWLRGGKASSLCARGKALSSAQLRALGPLELLRLGLDCQAAFPLEGRLPCARAPGAHALLSIDRALLDAQPARPEPRGDATPRGLFSAPADTLAFQSHEVPSALPLLPPSPTAARQS